MSIGGNIKRLREDMSLTGKELGKAVNVTSSMIYQIERGTKVPNLLLSKQIAAVLGCSVEDLLAEE